MSLPPEALPTLAFTFLQPEGDLPGIEARETAMREALAPLGVLDVRAVSTGQIGPDRDTQFLTLETGALRVTLDTPDGARWIIDAADLERGRAGTWCVHTRHARARVEGATDVRALLATLERVVAGFAAFGLRDMSFLWGSHFGRSLRGPLLAAGHARELRELTGLRAVAWLDPTVLLDAWQPTLDLSESPELKIPELLAAIPSPERFLCLDLRSSGLLALPVALTRYARVRRLELAGNPLSALDPQVLAALPSLETIGLDPGQVSADMERGLERRGLRVSR